MVAAAGPARPALHLVSTLCRAVHLSQLPACGSHYITQHVKGKQAVQSSHQVGDGLTVHRGGCLARRPPQRRQQWLTEANLQSSERQVHSWLLPAKTTYSGC